MIPVIAPIWFLLVMALPGKHRPRTTTYHHMAGDGSTVQLPDSY